MNRPQSILLATITAFTLFLTACGGSSSNTPPAITVSVSAPTSLATGATASITATVSNNTGVNWTVTCTTSPCGSFNPASTGSGTATTYTAPTTPNTVTITATSTSDSTKSGTASITIAAPPISVAFNPAAPPSITIGTTSSLTAVVTNDSKSAGVTWTVTCGSSACGSFNPTSTASGTATTYTPPAAVPTNNTVTVTATSVTDTTKSVSATITIVTPALTVSFNPAPPSSMSVGATTSLTSIVSNDSKNGGVTWTVTCGSSACGSFNPTSTASGTATTYTAPATIPTPNTVTIKATSVTDTTKSVSATITIGAVLADGAYVYHFAGWDSNGPDFFAGAFTVAGGLITGGEQDVSNTMMGYTDPLVPANCSLSGAGSNIQVVLATSNTNIGVSGIETLRGKLVSSSRVLISEFDSFGTATGSIDLQTSAAAPSGGYAFAISGWDLGSQVSTLVLGGILNISGTSLSIANSIFDYNLNGTAARSLAFSSGSISAPDSFGRVSFNLTPASTTNVPQFVLTGYIVGPGQIQLVESQTDALMDDLGGMALGQGTNTNNFNVNSITGKTYVYGGRGDDVNNVVAIGSTFAFNSSAAISGTLALNDGTAFGAFPFTSGVATVDTTGRVSLVGISIPALSTASFNFQLYLDGNGNAMVIGVDTLETTAGPAYLQSATGDFEGSYAIVGDGFLNLTGVPNWGAVGPVTVASDTFNGSTDYNYQGATPASAQALTGTENSSNATLSLVGLDATSFSSSRAYTYFPIDSKRVLAIETDGTQIGLVTLESSH